MSHNLVPTQSLSSVEGGVDMLKMYTFYYASSVVSG